MKDNDTLQQHNIKDGLTIHLVIRAVPRPTESGPSRPPGNPKSKNCFKFENTLIRLQKMTCQLGNINEGQANVKKFIIPCILPHYISFLNA